MATSDTNRRLLKLLLAISSAILVLFALVLIFHGVWCPEKAHENVLMGYGNERWLVRKFHCESFGHWFNARRHPAPPPEGTSLPVVDPPDVFLGLFLPPPVFAMIIGILYVAFVGLIFVMGLMGAFTPNFGQIKLFRSYLTSAAIVNAVYFVVALAFSVSLLRRDAQCREALGPETPGCICDGLKAQGLPLCAHYVLTVILSAVCLVLSLICIPMSRKAASEFKQKKSE